jgi:predicted TIM-barrel fold metal-dependent hydrolase
LEFDEGHIPPWLSGHRSSGSGYYRFWFVDGKLFPHRVRNDERTGTTQETRELVDVAARLRDMDQLQVDTQVIYPTVFLNEITDRADVQVALYKSYNRWLSERCADSIGRLRWVAMIPYRSMSDALDEIRHAKAHGAVGIFKLGVEAGALAASDPAFLPAYQLAAELDLPVCIHAGAGLTSVVPNLSAFVRGDAETFPVQAAFSSLLNAKIYEKVPDLKIGFIEASSAWLPLILGRNGWTWASGGSRTTEKLSDLGFYVTCETYEDIPYLLNVVGDDNSFVVGSDYTHGDRASVLDAHPKIMQRDDIDPRTATKITSGNARVFYGL